MELRFRLRFFLEPCLQIVVQLTLNLQYRVLLLEVFHLLLLLFDDLVELSEATVTFTLLQILSLGVLLVDVELAFLTLKLFTVTVHHDVPFKLSRMARDELIALEWAFLDLQVMKVELPFLIGILSVACLTLEHERVEHFSLESILSQRLEDILTSRAVHGLTALNAVVAEDVLTRGADLEVFHDAVANRALKLRGQALRCGCRAI